MGCAIVHEKHGRTGVVFPFAPLGQKRDLDIGSPLSESGRGTESVLLIIEDGFLGRVSEDAKLRFDRLAWEDSEGLSCTPSAAIQTTSVDRLVPRSTGNRMEFGGESASTTTFSMQASIKSPSRVSSTFNLNARATGCILDSNLAEDSSIWFGLAKARSASTGMPLTVFRADISLNMWFIG
jgi:hypothetical protein